MTMPSLPANGSGECPPDDRLQRVIQYSAALVIDREAAAYWMPRMRGA